MSKWIEISLHSGTIYSYESDHTILTQDSTDEIHAHNIKQKNYSNFCKGKRTQLNFGFLGVYT